MSPDGTSVYVAAETANTVLQFDVGAGGRLSPKTPATVPAGRDPAGLTISPDGGSVYVANQSSGDVSQYDIGPGGGLSPKSPPTVAVGAPIRVVPVRDSVEPAVTADHQGAVQRWRLAQLPAVQEPGGVHRLRRARPRTTGGERDGISRRAVGVAALDEKRQSCFAWKAAVQAGPLRRGGRDSVVPTEEGQRQTPIRRAIRRVSVMRPWRVLCRSTQSASHGGSLGSRWCSPRAAMLLFDVRRPGGFEARGSAGQRHQAGPFRLNCGPQRRRRRHASARLQLRRPLPGR